MHIVMLSDWETQYGGAAISASRLAEAFIQSGHKVSRIVSLGDNQPHPWSTYQLSPSTWGWGLAKIFPERFASRLLIPDILRKFKRLLDDLQPDIIHIHNIHGAVSSFWNVELIRICGDYAPVVWTLHDMWSFTGRCAYNYGCLKYLTGCDATCPTPGEYPALSPNQITHSWEQRRSIIQEMRDIIAVAPSNWLALVALGGLWHGKRVEVIPYGLPLNIYEPIDRSIAHKALGITSEGPVLLIAAHRLDDKRKGGRIALQAIEQSSYKPLSLITMGSGSLRSQIPGVTIIPLGFIDHERTRALAYSAADIYLHPALADNLPNTIMEAISCGTPVVAYSIGGIPDLVRPEVTGWLVNEPTPNALASGLNQALTDLIHNKTSSFSCRETAEQEYSMSLQAERYLTLFREMR